MDYSTGLKGFRLYDIKKKVFFISRDVLFFEDFFPFHVVKDNVDVVPTVNFLEEIVLPCSFENTIPTIHQLNNISVDDNDIFGVIPDVYDTNIIPHDLNNISVDAFSIDLAICNNASHELDDFAPNHNNTSASIVESSTSMPYVSNDIAVIKNPL